ncbi:MAG: hypothetical protein HY928_00295 [Elusimicrobia bacterium]|nr:hypothetical protein [Elusimicrobiota bacterium]
MIKRDWFLNLIERAGPVMKKLAGLRQADRLRDAPQVIEQGCRELLNIDGRMLLAFSAQDLGDLLSLDEGQASGKCFLAAELLAEGGDDAESRLKAVELYLRSAAKGRKAAVAASARFRACLAAVDRAALSDGAAAALDSVPPAV